MSPSELEKRIIDSLSQGDCVLAELTERARADGREVLKLLHLMAADKRVRSSLLDGRVMWGLGQNSGVQREQVKQEPAKVVRAEPAPVIAPAVPQPDPVVEASAIVKPAKRKRNQTIIVRQAVQITELSITPVHGGDCLITDGEKICSESVGEPMQVFVPVADIPGLIDALQQILEAA